MIKLTQKLLTVFIFFVILFDATGFTFWELRTSAQNDLLFESNFDSYVGSTERSYLPENWSNMAMVGSGSDFCIGEGVFPRQDASCKFYSSTANTLFLNKNLSGLDGKVLMEASIRAEDSLLTRNVIVGGENLVSFSTGGAIKVNGFSIGEMYKTSVWYYISAVIDISAKTAGIFINGKTVALEVKLGDDFKASFFKIEQKGQNGTVGIMYVDDVKLYQEEDLRVVSTNLKNPLTSKYEVPVDMKAALCFSKEVMPETFDDIIISDCLGNLVEITVEAERNSCNIKFSQPLEPLKTYKIDLSALRDDIGISIYDDVLTFVTEPYERPSADKIISDLIIVNPQNGHPRIMATDEIFADIMQRKVTDVNTIHIYNKLKAAADTLLANPVVLVQDGLSTPGFYEDISMLCLVYVISGESIYAQRVWEELDVKGEFLNWEVPNNNFLAVAYLTKAFAVAYDWLYSYWNNGQREYIRNKIIEKGLMKGLDAYRNPTEKWVLNAKSNWNITCNAGMAMGALAIADESPQLAGEILEASLRSIELALPQFKPDGAWTEGVYYGSFTINSLVQLISSFDTAVNSNYGVLNSLTSLSRIGYYPLNMTGTNGYFNFSDSESALSSHNVLPELFWLASKCKDSYLGGVRLSRIVSNRVEVKTADLLWYDKNYANSSAINPYLDDYFRQTEVVSLRKRISGGFVAAFHAGDNKAGHSQLDTGTFVLDAMGARFAEDLGGDDYGLPGYFTYNRWNYYRNRAEGHNTLVINPDGQPDQDILSFSKIEKYDTAYDRGFAIADMTSAYVKNASMVKRGMKLFEDRTKFLVQDEVQMRGPSELWWFMHTRAQIQISDDGKSAVLTRSGKRLWIGLLSPYNAEFSVLDAQPLPTTVMLDGQNLNSGVKKLTIHLSRVTAARITVLFSPLMDGEQTPSDLQILENRPPLLVDEPTVNKNHLGELESVVNIENTTQNTKDTVLIFAVYKDGALVHVSADSVEILGGGQKTAKTVAPAEYADNESYHYKTFVWQSTSNARPLEFAIIPYVVPLDKW